jgi:hypothetical protein
MDQIKLNAQFANDVSSENTENPAAASPVAAMESLSGDARR